MDNQNDINAKMRQVIRQLKQYSTDGLNFEKAKEKLLSLGHTEAEINAASDAYQYGVTPEQPDIPNKAVEYYQAHPDQAAKDGSNLLQAQRKEELTDERNQAILDAAAAKTAGQFGIMGLDAQVEFSRRFASDVGISFWLLVAAGIAIDIGTYFFVSWFHIISGVLSIILVVIIIKRMK
jgi:hypothetical protein